jgi:hypothetical protein
MDRELAGLSPPIYPPYKADASRPFIPKTVLYDRLVINYMFQKMYNDNKCVLNLDIYFWGGERGACVLLYLSRSG